MAKKPFAVRIDDATTMQFKALATVKGKDNSTLFSIMVNEFSKALSEEEALAYEALLRLWQTKAEG